MTNMTDIRQSLKSLRDDAADADRSMRESMTVPSNVRSFVDGFDDRVASHAIVSINPYLAADLWRGAYLAVSGLSRGDYFEVRSSLNLIVDELDALIEELPFSQFAEIPDVLKLTSRILSVTQQQYADLLGVSTSTLRRWQNGHSKPNPQVDSKIRFVGKLVSQLSYTLPQRGIYTWLYRHQRDLRQRPVDMFDDPSKYDAVLTLAASFRSQSG